MLTNTSKPQHLVIFGGTFDPPHIGHIHTALAVQAHIPFARFIFLPCKTPVLKDNSVATPSQRVQMLTLALAPYSTFSVDQREILRDTPSFMIDTLKSFREEFGEQIPITLLLGMDAFLALPQWHDWQHLLAHCHLLVMQRQEAMPTKIPKELMTLLQQHEVRNKMDLLSKPFGRIYQFDAGDYPISSRVLREKMKAGEDVRAFLPSSVYHYAVLNKIYAGLND